MGTVKVCVDTDHRSLFMSFISEDITPASLNLWKMFYQPSLQLNGGRKIHEMLHRFTYNYQNQDKPCM